MKKGNGVETAKLLDISVPRLLQLAQEGIVPKPSTPGQYDPLACLHSYIRHLRKEKEHGTKGLADERAELTRVQKDLALENLRKVRGETLDTAEAVAAWANLAAATRAKLLSIPSRAAPMVKTAKTLPKIKALLESEINDALRDIGSADFGKRIFADARREGRDSSPHGDTPAGKVERKRVGRQKQGTKRGSKRGTGKVAN